jgi:hypothetical protein
MAEEKGALQAAREWIVDHKLRAVGASPNFSCFRRRTFFSRRVP